MTVLVKTIEHLHSIAFSLKSRLLVNYFESLLYCANDFQQNFIRCIGKLAVANQIISRFDQAVYNHPSLKIT